MHPPYEIPPAVAARLVERRGRIHPFASIDPRRTALLVIDMQNAFCAPGMALHVPSAREVVDNINILAATARDVGATVVWLQMTVPTMADWPVFLDQLLAPEHGQRVQEELEPGSVGHALWPSLQVDTERDLFLRKRRFSALVQGSSDLGAELARRGMDTVVIAGTLTNVCCESTARDAAMLDYRVFMVADANAARTDADHATSLTNILQVFGDVRTTAEMVALLRRAD